MHISRKEAAKEIYLTWLCLGEMASGSCLVGVLRQAIFCNMSTEDKGYKGL